MAAEGRRLDLILTVPMADLAGTERVPHSPGARAAIAARIEALRGAGPVTVADATCAVEQFDLSLPPDFAAAIASVAASGDGPDGHDHHPGHQRDDDAHEHDAHEHDADEHGAHEQGAHEHEAHAHEHPEHDAGERDPGASGTHDDDHAPHEDAVASWVLRCDAPARRLTVTLFDAMPSLVELRVQMISDAGQGAARLRSDRRRLELP